MGECGFGGGMMEKRTIFCFVLCVIATRSSQKFFIYDWPQQVVNRWPCNYTFHSLSIAEEFGENFGCGMLRNPDTGVYHTHQYSLFKLFYFRLLESPYRTTNPAEASLFFIPYDIGMDSSTRRNDGALARTDCPMMLNVLKLLNDPMPNSEQNYFRRNNGSDHFILHSVNQMMVYYVHHGCMELYKACFHCTKLSIDTYNVGMFRYIDENQHMRNNWVSIPFPSNIHYSPRVLQLPWRQLNDASRVPLAFMGSAAVTAKMQKKLRQVIIQQCKKFSATKECLLVMLWTHHSQTQIFQGPDDSGVYSKARLCLMPGGDFPTRKGVLDAMLSGCVPVTFQLEAAHTQWGWHWGPGANAASQCLIYVPRAEVLRDPRGTFLRLIAMSRDQGLMRAKLRAIERVARRLQYDVPSKRGGLGPFTEPHCLPNGANNGTDTVIPRELAAPGGTLHAGAGRGEWRRGPDVSLRPLSDPEDAVATWQPKPFNRHADAVDVVLAHLLDLEFS